MPAPVSPGARVRYRDVEGIVTTVTEKRHGARPSTWMVVIVTTNAGGLAGHLVAEIDGVEPEPRLRLVA